MQNLEQIAIAKKFSGENLRNTNWLITSDYTVEPKERNSMLSNFV